MRSGRRDPATPTRPAETVWTRRKALAGRQAKGCQSRRTFRRIHCSGKPGPTRPEGARAPRAGNGQRADIACDLPALEIRKPMKTGSGDNRGVGEAKVFEITAVVSVAIRTAGANLRGIWEGAGLELGAQPKLLPGQDGIGIAQGRRP